MREGGEGDSLHWERHNQISCQRCVCCFFVLFVFSSIAFTSIQSVQNPIMYQDTFVRANLIFKVVWDA